MSRRYLLLIVILALGAVLIGGYLLFGAGDRAPIPTASLEAESPSAMPQADDLPEEAHAEPAKPLMGRVDEAISSQADSSRLPVASEAPILGKKWMLSRLGETDISAEGRAPFLTLEEAESRVTGMAGCNRFSGTFALDGDALSFSHDFMMTRMACDAMETESAFVGALQKVESWRVEGDRLILMDKDKSELARLIDVASTAP